MRFKTVLRFAALVVLLAAAAQASVLFGGRMNPDRAWAVVDPEDCLDEHKEVFIPDRLPAADIVFILDTTGSMGDEIDALLANIDSIASRILPLVDNPAFALITHRDYDFNGASCGYNQRYGAAGDYPYRLEVPLTQNIADLQAALGALSAYGGGDLPESYARCLFEAYSDTALNLRPEAHKIVVEFGDDVPHDCDVLACIGQPGTTTGLDPGRDGALNTGDDLPILEVIQGLVDHCFTLLYIYSKENPVHLQAWDCWARQTGGQAFQINPDGTIPGGLDFAQVVSDLVAQAVSVCHTVSLKTSPGFENWLVTATPPGYTDVARPATLSFDIRLCPPDGTPPGTYTFKVQAVCDLADCGGGIVFAEQEVTIVVPEPCAAHARAGNDTAVCAGGSTALDGGASALDFCPGSAEYRWLDGAVEVCPWSPSPTCAVTPSASTTYTLEVRCDTEPDCIAQDTLTVAVVAPPQPDPGPAREVCEGEEITLDGGATLDPGCPGGLEYRWLDGAAEVCPWSSSARCRTTPARITTYTLEVRCEGLQECAGAAAVVITVKRCPTAVRYGSFTVATKTSDRVEISWTTLMEIGALGFQVQAAASPGSAGAERTLSFVPARGAGAAYAFTLEERSAARLWFRVVEVTAAGPGDATPWRRASQALRRGRTARCK